MSQNANALTTAAEAQTINYPPAFLGLGASVMDITALLLCGLKTLCFRRRSGRKLSDLNQNCYQTGLSIDF
jgi:hypothetical protein